MRPSDHSPSNPRLRLVRRLAARRQRDRTGLFSCEGEDLVEAALAAGLEPVHPAGREVPSRVSPAASSSSPRLSRKSRPRPSAASDCCLRRDDLPRLDARTPPPVGLARSGNIGTLVRAADGLGPAFIALSSGRGPDRPQGAPGIVGRDLPRADCGVRRGPGRPSSRSSRTAESRSTSWISTRGRPSCSARSGRAPRGGDRRV